MKKLCLLLSLLLLSACGTSSAQQKRPRVVATAYPLYEAAASIGGRNIHATNLLPLDTHAALTPKKAEMLRTADVAIVLGGGTQPQIDAIVAQRTRPTISILGTGDLHAATNDFNLWLDPDKMATIAEVVTESIRPLVPSKDRAIQRNLGRYMAGLASVDADYSKTLAQCKRSVVLVESPNFDVLAHRYGLNQVAVGSISLHDENADLRNAISANKATTVFANKLPSLEDASKIRDAYGVRVAVLDPIVTQTDQARRGGASYGVVMRLNLDALRAALDCRPKTDK